MPNLFYRFNPQAISRAGIIAWFLSLVAIFVTDHNPFVMAACTGHFVALVIYRRKQLK
jgi:hypothetical protein